jgi:hypothetical protein
MSWFEPIAIKIMYTAPPVPRIRVTPLWQDWGEQLRSLGRSEGLEELQPHLEAVIADAFLTPTGLGHFLESRAADLSYDLYVRASDFALAAVGEKPIGAWVLALISLLGFDRWAARACANTSYELLPPGWELVPYACARASAEVGSYTGAKELVTRTYDMLDSYRFQQRWRIEGALESFRDLAGWIDRKYSAAIRNLAEDLRESCATSHNSFRSEVGAMAWTLGMVPESSCFRHSSPTTTLSRRFFYQLVSHSMALIPSDPLIQHVWLALKDRGPFNVRDHEPLFTLINSRYAGLLDELLPYDAPALYASNLISLLRGELQPDLVNIYLGSRSFWSLFPPINTLRMHALAALLLDAGGQLSNRSEVWYGLTADAAQLREAADLDFSTIPLSLRAACGRFYLIESELATLVASTENSSVSKMMEALDRQRNSAFSHSVRLVGPRASDAEANCLGNLLEEERSLSQRARGAYFEILLPKLPRHYWYYGSKGSKPDPETAPERFLKLETELSRVREIMRNVAPSYIYRRADSKTGLPGLVDALNAHHRIAEVQ